MVWEEGSIINWGNLEQKIYNWVHQDPNDIQQIKNRAMIVATAPIFIGFALGLVAIAIIDICSIL